MSTSTSSSSPERFKLIFFTPPSHLPAIKTAIFSTGAGRYEKYSECCFTSPGIGQFRPAANANPAIGEAGGKLEEVEEVRCEILCVGREVTRRAVEELKRYACQFNTGRGLGGLDMADGLLDVGRTRMRRLLMM
jgi:hypothetical protein